MSRHLPRWLLLLLALAVAVAGRADSTEPAEGGDDEQTLHAAGLGTDGPSLLAFFQARARTAIDRDRLRVLVRQFAADDHRERSLATAEFLGLGPLAVPTLRQMANDLNQPAIAARAARCLKWLEGSSRSMLPIAAARVLTKHKPDGAPAALLAYLPFADNAEVGRAVTAALAAVAAPGGKPDPALLRALTDPVAARRVAAGVALSLAVPPEEVPAVRQLLKDPAPGVRRRIALALAEAHDAEAVPVLIDLMAEPPAERQPFEEMLQQLAGEWAPVVGFAGEDEIARQIRRDAWASWWNNADGPSLLAAVRKRTLTAQDRVKIQALIAKLGSGDFTARETASKELFLLGRRSLPQLHEAVKSKDAEVSRRAKLLIEQIELEPAHHLPAAAVRLLAMRKPAGSAEALLAYLPFAEDESLSSEVQKSLTALALRGGKPEPVLVRALSDPQPLLRSAAAEALAKGAGSEGRAAVRKLLKDGAAAVRLRVALALAVARERQAVPVLIDLLAVLPSDQLGQAEDALYQLAGESAPSASPGDKPEERQKCRDAWAAWWKTNAPRVDLARLTTRPWFGFTLLCDCGNNRVFEIGRDGKQRWSIENIQFPVDAWVLPGNRVLVAEWNGRRITERDLKGNVLWSKEGLPGNPVNVQRLRNGNTFIALDSQIMEVDRAGKTVYTIANVGGITAAYRARNGNIVCLSQNAQCLILDTAGKQLKSFASNRQAGWTSGIDLLSNGRILVTQPDRNKVTEYDTEGKAILELDTPLGTTATGLPNGHILVGSHQAQRAFEVDRTGKVVWEYKASGPIFRARRR